MFKVASSIERQNPLRIVQYSRQFRTLRLVTLNSVHLYHVLHAVILKSCHLKINYNPPSWPFLRSKKM